MNIVKAIFWTGAVLISIGLALMTFAPLMIFLGYGIVVVIVAAFVLGVVALSSRNDKKQTET